MTEDIITVDMSNLAPEACSPRIARWHDSGIHTTFHSISARLKESNHFRAVTYGVEFSCQRFLPKAAIIGLRHGEGKNTYHIPKQVEVRFLRHIHAKFYLLYREPTSLLPYMVIVGSMNYVYSGMVECCVELTEKKHLTNFQAIYNELWIQGEEPKPIQALKAFKEKEELK